MSHLHTPNATRVHFFDLDFELVGDSIIAITDEENVSCEMTTDRMAVKSAATRW